MYIPKNKFQKFGISKSRGIGICIFKKPPSDSDKFILVSLLLETQIKRQQLEKGQQHRFVKWRNTGGCRTSGCWSSDSFLPF